MDEIKHAPRDRRVYLDSRKLIEVRLPYQKALTDEAKSQAVEAVRERYGDEAAALTGAALDQVIARVVPSVNWAVEARAGMRGNSVKGVARGEFALPLPPAWLKLPEGAPAPELFVSASFGFDGNLATGRLDLAKVRAEAGFRTNLPGNQAVISVSSVVEGTTVEHAPLLQSKASLSPSVPLKTTA